ncbi:MAG: hypothetical protein M3O50_06620, partial [Myxococcota bacterium]|nr:hypothetical protein [Myxococcota bacterium]
MTGRRYRATDGSWAVPYTDGRRFVLSRNTGPGPALAVASGAIAQAAGIVAHALPLPTAWQPPIIYLGLATTGLPLLLAPWPAIEDALSRLRVPRHLVVTRTSGDPRF